MASGDEASFIAAFKLHVTGALFWFGLAPSNQMGLHAYIKTTSFASGHCTNVIVNPLVGENMLDTLDADSTIK